MLKYMKNAGCWQISYGVESGSQRLLDLIHKDTTKTKAMETFALTKKLGITIRGFFMLGLPTETAEESMETIQFAKELDPLWAQFTITVPYPGTPIFKQLDSEGKIMHYRWSHYNTWGGWVNRQLPFVPEGRTEEELKSLQKKRCGCTTWRQRSWWNLSNQYLPYPILWNTSTDSLSWLRLQLKKIGDTELLDFYIWVSYSEDYWLYL